MVFPFLCVLHDIMVVVMLSVCIYTNTLTIINVPVSATPLCDHAS